MAIEQRMNICSACGHSNPARLDQCEECGKDVIRKTSDLIDEIWFGPTLNRVRELMRRGVDIASLQTMAGQTLLSSAVSPAHLNVELVKLLLAHGASVNVKDCCGCSPLLTAVGSASAEAVELLLQAGANPNMTNGRGISPLMRAAGLGLEPVVARLLAAGAYPNSTDCEQRTALHCAIGGEHLKVIHILLDHGANIEAMDYEGRTPLAYATFHGCVNVAGLLRRRGADRTFDLGDRDPYVIAFTSSMNALSHGCPGFFFGGDYVDAESGLPVQMSGLCNSRSVFRREEGHNDGIREFIRLHGPPWNSRLSWLEMIGNPARYITTQTPLPLEPNGPPVTAPDGVTTLQLKPPDVSWLHHQPLFLSSPKLWPEGRLYLDDFASYETDPAPRGKPRPVLGQHWSERARCRDVTLWVEHPRHKQMQIEVCWGPAGSELAVLIQRRPNQKRGRPCEGKCILDLQLGLWLSSTISVDWQERRIAWGKTMWGLR